MALGGGSDGAINGTYMYCSLTYFFLEKGPKSQPLLEGMQNEDSRFEPRPVGSHPSSPQPHRAASSSALTCRSEDTMQIKLHY